MSSGTVRVAIVDDHPMFRMGLAASIGEMEGIELVGQAERAGDVAELLTETLARRACCSTCGFPTATGSTSTGRCGSTHPSVKVVMLTMSEELDTVRTALRDGATGYLVKGALPETVENAIRLAAAGAMPLDPMVMDGLIAPDRAPVPDGIRIRYPFPQLTDSGAGRARRASPRAQQRDGGTNRCT